MSESWKAHVPDSGGAVGLDRFAFITTADVRGVDVGERCRSLRLLRASETGYQKVERSRFKFQKELANVCLDFLQRRFAARVIRNGHQAFALMGSA